MESNEKANRDVLSELKILFWMLMGEQRIKKNYPEPFRNPDCYHKASVYSGNRSKHTCKLYTSQGNIQGSECEQSSARNQEWVVCPRIVLLIDRNAS